MTGGARIQIRSGCLTFSRQNSRTAKLNAVTLNACHLHRSYLSQDFHVMAWENSPTP